MENSILQAIALFIFTLNLLACQATTLSNQNPASLSSHILTKSSNTLPPFTSTPTLPTAPTIEFTPSPITPTLPAASTIEFIPSPKNIIFNENCASYTNNYEFLAQGRVLYENTEGIWSISLKSLEPTLSYSVPTENTSWFVLQTGSSKILIYTLFSDLSGTYQIYDILSGEKIGQPINSEWYPYEKWLKSGSFILKEEEHILNVGVNKKHIEINSTSQNIKSSEQFVDLPGYFFQNEPFYLGIFSQPLDENLILYTQWDTEKETVNILLKNSVTGQILWQKENVGFAPYPYTQPFWEPHNQNLLFSVYEEQEGQLYNHLILLDSLGQPIELPSQPFPMMKDILQVSELSISPQGQYIYYSLAYFNQNKQAVILDRLSSKAYKICLNDNVFINGQWISNTEFLYKTDLKNGKQALSVFNVSTQTTQLIIESEIDSYAWLPEVQKQP